MRMYQDSVVYIMAVTAYNQEVPADKGASHILACSEARQSVAYTSIFAIFNKLTLLFSS